MATRAKEEIRAVLEGWPDIFEREFGNPLDKEKMKVILNKMIEEKENEIIRRKFFEYNAIELRSVIEELEPKGLPMPVKTGKSLKTAQSKIK